MFCFVFVVKLLFFESSFISTSILGLFVVFFKGTDGLFLVIILGDGKLICWWLGPLVLYFDDGWVGFVALVIRCLLGRHRRTTAAERALSKAARTKLARPF